MDEEKYVQDAMNTWRSDLKQEEQGLKDEVKKIEQQIEILRAKQYVISLAAQRFSTKEQADKFYEELDGAKITSEIETKEQILEGIKKKLRNKTMYNRAIFEAINSQ